MNTIIENANVQNATVIEKHKVILGAFGDGRYSPAMSELYRDSQRLLGLSKEQAHAVAVRLGIDAGQLGAGKVGISFGKSVSKDGKRTLKEIVKSMKIIDSWAMSIGAICAQLDDTRKQGLVVVECTINKTLMDAVNVAASRIEPADKLEA